MLIYQVNIQYIVSHIVSVQLSVAFIQLGPEDYIQGHEHHHGHKCHVSTGHSKFPLNCSFFGAE